MVEKPAFRVTESPFRISQYGMPTLKISLAIDQVLFDDIIRNLQLIHEILDVTDMKDHVEFI